MTGAEALGDGVRTLSVLFTDLVGSTELFPRVGEDQAEKLRSRHLSILRHAVDRHGGREVKAFHSVGELELKGLPAPVEACEVAWEPASGRTIRAVLADDAVLVREGVARLLEENGISVVAQAGDGEELLSCVARPAPTSRSPTCACRLPARSRASRPPSGFAQSTPAWRCWCSHSTSRAATPAG